MKTHIKHLLRLTFATISFILISLNATAQMTDDIMRSDYNIDPDKCGEFSIEIDNTLFFKNNEFDGKIIKGYSLPGLWIQPKLIYYPLPNIKLELGAHALIYRGAYKYPNYAYNDISLWKGTQYQKGAHILPFVRGQVSFKNLNIVLGNIYGAQNHSLIEPLYNTELNLTADPEAGLQILYDRSRFHLDLWLNWESFIFDKDTHQEAFTIGLSTKTLLNDPSKLWHFYSPLQIVGQHRGGEALIGNNRPVSTLINAALGVGATWNINPYRQWYKRMHFEVDALGYYQQSGDLWPFNKGAGLYARTTLDIHDDFLVNAGYLYCKNFISLFGHPYYGAVSMIEEGMTLRNPQTFTITAEYSRTFAKHFGIGAKTEMYYNVPGTMQFKEGEKIKGANSFNFTIGIYLRVNPSFLIKRF